MFDEYLEAVGASPVLRARVNHLYGLVTKVVPADAIPFAFIANALDEENNLQWRSLWFYGPEYCSELTNFQWTDSFDWVHVSKIIRWDVSSENFDFTAAASNSKYSIKWNLGTVTGTMTAVGANCNQLLHFTKTTVVPRSI